MLVLWSELFGNFDSCSNFAKYLQSSSKLIICQNYLHQLMNENTSLSHFLLCPVVTNKFVWNRFLIQ